MGEPDGIAFRPFGSVDLAACLRLFDANCPEFFAPAEQADYRAFLATEPDGYELCVAGGRVVGAFGLIGDDPRSRRLNWIMLDPAFRGRGLGSAIMSRVLASARRAGVRVIEIAASHKSAPFFDRFGASPVRVTEHGWGRDMHRVDMEIALR
ncbi:MAG: GNAT family N-acetyltransferase [Gemmatimonadales bacterium]